MRRGSEEGGKAQTHVVDPVLRRRFHNLVDHRPPRIRIRHDSPFRSDELTGPGSLRVQERMVRYVRIIDEMGERGEGGTGGGRTVCPVGGQSCCAKIPKSSLTICEPSISVSEQYATERKERERQGTGNEMLNRSSKPQEMLTYGPKWANPVEGVTSWSRGVAISGPVCSREADQSVPERGGKGGEGRRTNRQDEVE